MASHRRASGTAESRSAGSRNSSRADPERRSVAAAFIATTGGESGGGSSTPEAKLKVFSSSGGRSPSAGFSTMGTAQAKSSCARTSFGDFFGCQLGWALSHTAQRAAVAALTLWWRTFFVNEADALSGRMDAYHSEADSHRRHEKHKRYADDRFHRQSPFPDCITFGAHQSDTDLTQVLVLGFWDMIQNTRNRCYKRRPGPRLEAESARDGSSLLIGECDGFGRLPASTSFSL